MVPDFWKPLTADYVAAGAFFFSENGPQIFDMSLESPGTGGTSIRLSLHETNETYPYTLGRGWAYISDMSSTSGYMGAKYFQEFGPRFFDMSSASGYMGAKYFQEFGP